MKITKISYERLYAFKNFENERLSIEMEINEEREVKRAFIEIKKIIEENRTKN